MGADGIDGASRATGRTGLGQLVPCAVSAHLSDVLGRASGLPRFTFRRPPRTRGQSHRAQSARAPVHRYHDEFHVPERGLVVLLHAHPVLSNVSPALLGGEKIWSVALPAWRVRAR